MPNMQSGPNMLPFCRADERAVEKFLRLSRLGMQRQLQKQLKPKGLEPRRL